MAGKTLVGWLDNYSKRIRVIADDYKALEQKLSVMSEDQPYFKKLWNAMVKKDVKGITDAINEARIDFMAKMEFLRKKIKELSKNPEELAKTYSGTELRVLFREAGIG